MLHDFKHDVFRPQTYMFAIIDCGDRMTKNIGMVFKLNLKLRYDNRYLVQL